MKYLIVTSVLVMIIGLSFAQNDTVVDNPNKMTLVEKDGAKGIIDNNGKFDYKKLD